MGAAAGWYGRVYEPGAALRRHERGARGTGGCAAAVATPAAPASAAPAPSDPFASLMGGMPTKHK